MELKEERKYKESYEHQLETINRKFSSWGIKEETDIEEFIPKMNAQKHSLEKQLVGSPPKEYSDKQPGSQKIARNEPDRIALAGIYLGDSPQAVMRVLGSDFNEKYFEEGGYFEEPYFQWSFSKGIWVIVGKESQEVLQIKAWGHNLENSLGDRVGDSAEKILEKNRAKYPELKSIHTNSILAGWFEVDDGALLIYDCDPNDQSMVNEEIGPEAKIAAMTLAYKKYID